MVVVHDVCYRARPDFYTDARGRLSAAWHRLQYRVIAKKAEHIITVSKFSRSELQRYYGVNPDRVTVIPNAWQHMQRTEPDPAAFEKWPRAPPGRILFLYVQSAQK